jgi:hypothetical protein
MFWPEIVAAAIAAAIRGDRDAFERLLESRNGRFQQIRGAIQIAGEAILDGVPAPAGSVAFAPGMLLPVLGKTEGWYESSDPAERAQQIDRELRARITEAHPDRLMAGNPAPEELRRRLLEVSNAHTSMLNALRTLVESA